MSSSLIFPDGTEIGVKELARRLEVVLKQYPDADLSREEDREELAAVQAAALLLPQPRGDIRPEPEQMALLPREGQVLAFPPTKDIR